MDKNSISRKNEYKKVALRFLKEAGILNQWKLYIKKEGYCSDFGKSAIKLDATNWYDVRCIDRIFGRTMFTKFLREKCDFNIIVGYSISDLFRTYLKKKHNGEYCLMIQDFVPKKIMDGIEKANTFNIIEFQKIVKK